MGTFARSKKDSRTRVKRLINSTVLAFIAGSLFTWKFPSAKQIENYESDLDAADTSVSTWESASSDPELQQLLSSRVCGSPAVDGYAHVNASCLIASPTAQWWYDTHPGERQASGSDLEVHIERFADYDGIAVGWGIGFKKKNIEECAKACREHKPDPRADGFGKLPCNAFCYCTEEICFEPDAHKHTKGDCWLKFTEGPASPEINMRGALSAAARERHKNAPKFVQWHAGVLLPKGVYLGNGSWSPRYSWLQPVDK